MDKVNSYPFLPSLSSLPFSRLPLLILFSSPFITSPSPSEFLSLSLFCPFRSSIYLLAYSPSLSLLLSLLLPLSWSSLPSMHITCSSFVFSLPSIYLVVFALNRAEYSKSPALHHACMMHCIMVSPLNDTCCLGCCADCLHQCSPFKQNPASFSWYQGSIYGFLHCSLGPEVYHFKLSCLALQPLDALMQGSHTLQW